MHTDLTQGSVTGSMLRFAAPLILSNLLQQLYNVADTLIVGRVLGAEALAAVGSAFTLMTFLTSVILGLCMGSGAVFSMLWGGKREEELRSGLFVSFVLVGLVTLVITALALLLMGPILTALQIPDSVRGGMADYLRIIFVGLFFTFVYNYMASVLRALGNSLLPLLVLGCAAAFNIVLDLFCVLTLDMGVAGAALATVIAQSASAGGLTLCAVRWAPGLLPERRHRRFRRDLAGKIAGYSVLTCLQQSVMNFGILMIQGLVNSFGVSVMAAFAAAVKIDAFAYMPVQDFGNAFSTFIAQNYGAGETGRIRKGIRSAVVTALAFCVVISVLVALFAPQLMGLFTQPGETEIVAVGVEYLRIEGACYCGIGCLFLLYGLYRAIGRPAMSLVLTVISLGTRVALAYALAPNPAFGLKAIWWAIPIGWGLADLAGFLWYRFGVLRRGI
jgi:putative MATE family efflux protein